MAIKSRVTPIRPGLPRRGPGRPRKPLTIQQAMDLGDRRAELLAVKRHLVAAIAIAVPRDLAPLARQLSAVNSDLANLDAAAEEAAQEAAAAAGGADVFDPDAI
jgi:hypothetical protein